MKNTKRQAFTIVELVIVIAVIAILSAVLIPTFGAIIKDANIAADRVEADAVTTHLGMNLNGIKSEEDIYNAIKGAYGQEKADTFAPRSAQYGYHYWYDVANNAIILSTYDELPAPTASAPVEQNGPALISAVTVASNSDFLTNVAGSFRLFDVNGSKYYIIDKGGVVGEALDALTSGNAGTIAAKVQELVTTAETISTAADLKVMANKVLENLSKVAIVTDGLTYVYDADKVETFYFAKDIKTISSNVVSNKDYIALASVLKDGKINIPASVERIEEGALMFDNPEQASTVQIVTEFETAALAAAAFKVGSTNGVIVVKDANYTLSGDALTNTADPNDTHPLGYSVNVESFEIALAGKGTATTDTALGSVYVSKDEVAQLTFKADGFVGTDGKTPSTTAVTWTLNGTTVSADANGIVAIDASIINAGVNNLVATAVAGGKTVTYTVNAVAVTSANVTLGGNSIDMTVGQNDTIPLSYDGKTSSLAIEVTALGYNYNPAPAVNCNTTLSVTAGEGNLFTIENNTLKINTSGSFSGTQTLTVNVGNNVSKTFTVSISDNSSSPFEVKFENTADYLYRVGNGNKITLNSLFEHVDGLILPTTGEVFKVEIYDITDPDGDSKSYISTTTTDSFYADISSANLTSSTWGSQTIDFGGVGIAEIVITSRTKTTTLKVEVVNATNVVGSLSSTNVTSDIVLLSDIESASRITVSGCTVYGNGFTITDKIPAAETTDVRGFIKLTNATLDNVVVQGQIYPKSVVFDRLNQYYSFCVYVTGSSNIYNSYISGCSYPVVMEGSTLNIENTTLDGGAVANLRIRAGAVTMKDCITTTATDSTSLKGLGVIISNADASLTLEGSFTQYNWIEKSEIPSDYEDYLKDLFSNSTHTFTNGGKTYLNAGVLCLDTSGTITADEARGKVVIDNINLIYDYIQKSVLGATFTCYAQKSDGMTADALTIPDAENITKATYAQKGQHALIPKYTFDHNTNSIPKETEDQMEYCYYSSDFNKVIIALDPDNPTFTYNPHILSVNSKYGKTMTVNIYFNGSATPIASNSSITFTEAGEYELVYKFKDTMNFNADGSKYSVDYELTLKFSVTVSEKAEVKVWTPEFSYKDTWAAESEIIIADNKNYVSPVTTNTTNFGTTTVGGKTIKYPKITVNGTNSSGGTYEDGDIYWYAPAFKAINIVDYNKDTGEVVTTYNSSYSKTPSSTVFGYGTITPFQNQTGPDYKKTYNKSSLGGFGYSSQKSSSGNKYVNLVEFWFYDADTENYYYYYVEYTFEAQEYVKGGGCVTPDTLITLADGSQVRVDSLTGNEMLMVWDHTTGTMTSAPIAYIVNHDEQASNHTVLSMNFSDGTVLDIIGEHVFYDKTLNKYVAITADNAKDYIGHEFVCRDGDKLKEIVLTGTEESVRNTGVYEVVTYKNVTCFTNGVLSASAYLDPLLNVFDIDADSFAYDMEQMIEDIQTYGLYTYEDFEGLVPEEAFEMYNAAYLKVAVGKGYITWNDILDLIEIYYNEDVQPIQ